MKLTTAEFACLRSQGLYITEKCDGCGTLLNQTMRFTINGKLEVYCSAVCRDRVYFGDRYETRTQAPSAGKPAGTLRKCQQCDQEFTDGRGKGLYRSGRCRLRAYRQRKASAAGLKRYAPSAPA